jgi:hypothetical protein
VDIAFQTIAKNALAQELEDDPLSLPQGVTLTQNDSNQQSKSNQCCN